jgi:RNA polymerase sigma factor (sigma-70 family)
LVRESVGENDTSLAAVRLRTEYYAGRVQLSADDTNDVASEAMVIASDRRVTNRGYLATWDEVDDFAHSIVKRFWDARRARNKRHLDLEGRIVLHVKAERSIDDDEDRILARIDARARRGDLIRALAILTARELQVTVWRRIKDLETSEIAELLGTDEGTVRVQLCHALKKLRAALAASRNGGREK